MQPPLRDLQGGKFTIYTSPLALPLGFPWGLVGFSVRRLYGISLAFMALISRFSSGSLILCVSGAAAHTPLAAGPGAQSPFFGLFLILGHALGWRGGG